MRKKLNYCSKAQIQSVEHHFFLFLQENQKYNISHYLDEIRLEAHIGENAVINTVVT